MWKEKMTPFTGLRSRSRLQRMFAGILALALLLGTFVPPVALAESDNEGQGAAPPGARPPALEGPGVEAGGEETQLGEVPIAAGEEEEEVVPPAAGEEASEPAPPTVAPPAVAPPAVTPEPETPSTAAAPGPAPAPGQPSYEPQEPTTDYEPATPPASPVRGEAIVEPGIGSSDPSGGAGPTGRPRQATVTPPVEESAPAAPEPAEAPEGSTATTPPSGLPEKPVTLKGRRTYRVAAGDCLWTIAAAILPPTASDEQIAAEVERIWELNAQRIGTGDPNLIDVGTVLRLS